MSYRDPAKHREANRRWYAKHSKSVSTWKPGSPGRPPAWAIAKGLVKRKGARMEPQCKLPDRMRAEHDFDAAGKCACGATQQGFAPRPELRPLAVVKAAKPAPPKASTPPAPAPKAAAQRKRIAAVAKPAAAGGQLPDLPSGGKSLDHAAVIAALQRHRDALEDRAADLTARVAAADRAIAALRELVQSA